MLDYLLQLIATIILVLVVIFDINNREVVNRLKTPHVQIIVAVIIMLIFVFLDPFAGFIFAIAIFIVYYKIFQMGKGNENILKSENRKFNNNVNKMFNSYITPVHLEQAQTNIVGDENKPVIGFNDGFIESKQKVYDTQGIGTKETVPGYTGTYFEELE